MVQNDKAMLIAAAFSGNTQLLEILLQKVPVDIDYDGMTALGAASSQGHSNAVELLLRHGADPNLRDSDGRTPLGYASGTGRLAVIELLIHSGSDPKMEVDLAGNTAIGSAAFMGHQDIVSYLKHLDDTSGP